MTRLFALNLSIRLLIGFAVRMQLQRRPLCLRAITIRTLNKERFAGRACFAASARPDPGSRAPTRRENCVRLDADFCAPSRRDF